VKLLFLLKLLRVKPLSLPKQLLALLPSLLRRLPVNLLSRLLTLALTMFLATLIPPPLIP
jgi:hypothetical protein